MCMCGQFLFLHINSAIYMNEIINTMIHIHEWTILYYAILPLFKINTIISILQRDIIMSPGHSVGRIGYDIPLVVVWTSSDFRFRNGVHFVQFRPYA